MLKGPQLSIMPRDNTRTIYHLTLIFSCSPRVGLGNGQRRNNGNDKFMEFLALHLQEIYALERTTTVLQYYTCFWTDLFLG